MGAKHKKTRKQKIIADLNRNVYALKNINISSHNLITTNERNNSYSYVLHDISKTGFLTIAIISLELILFFVLKKHILSIPNLNY
ncbi:MAG: hypothetical protein Q7R51_00425 [bacterium]|nr:hypothetical protein [bacterium]